MARGQPDGVRARPGSEEEEWVAGCGPNELYTPRHYEPTPEQKDIPECKDCIPEGKEPQEAGDKTAADPATEEQPEANGQELPPVAREDAHRVYGSAPPF